MSSMILREEMACESIVDYRLPWECTTKCCSTALWIRPLNCRPRVWPPVKPPLRSWVPVSNPSHTQTTIIISIYALILSLAIHTQNCLLMFSYILHRVTFLSPYSHFVYSFILQLLQQLACDGNPVLSKEVQVPDWLKVEFYHITQILNQSS